MKTQPIPQLKREMILAYKHNRYSQAHVRNVKKKIFVSENDINRYLCASYYYSTLGYRIKDWYYNGRLPLPSHMPDDNFFISGIANIPAYIGKLIELADTLCTEEQCRMHGFPDMTDSEYQTKNLELQQSNIEVWYRCCFGLMPGKEYLKPNEVGTTPFDQNFIE